MNDDRCNNVCIYRRTQPLYSVNDGLVVYPLTTSTSPVDPNRSAVVGTVAGTILTYASGRTAGFLSQTKFWFNKRIFFHKRKFFYHKQIFVFNHIFFHKRNFFHKLLLFFLQSQTFFFINEIYFLFFHKRNFCFFAEYFFTIEISQSSIAIELANYKQVR